MEFQLISPEQEASAGSKIAAGTRCLTALHVDTVPERLGENETLLILAHVVIIIAIDVQQKSTT